MTHVMKERIHYAAGPFLCPYCSNQSSLGCVMQDLRSYGASSKKRLLPALLSHFDLTACYMSSILTPFEEQLAEQLLGMGTGEDSEDVLERHSLRACLEEHLRQASCGAAPLLAKGAATMLQRYYEVIWSFSLPGLILVEVQRLLSCSLSDTSSRCLAGTSIITPHK